MRIGRLPNFLVVGAQRAGTTWIYEILRSHPEVVVPSTKELGFFTPLLSDNFGRSLDWYSSQFTGGGAAVGEITPEYLLDESTPQRIRNALGPHVKLVVSLRNPIDRAVSAYRKGIREGDWTCSLGDFLRQNMDWALDRGRYWTQVSRYLDVFDADRILILVYEDLERHPHDFARKIYSFLGVSSGHTPSAISKRFNMGPPSNSLAVRATVALRDQVYRVPGMKAGVKAVQRTAFGNLLMQTLLQTPNESPALGCDRTWLCQEFREEAKLIGDYIGRGLADEWAL